MARAYLQKYRQRPDSLLAAPHRAGQAGRMPEGRHIPMLAVRLTWAVRWAAHVDGQRAIEIYHRLHPDLSNAEDIMRTTTDVETDKSVVV